MIVYFDKKTTIKQHGMMQECMFVECIAIDFIGNKSIIKFGLNDFYVIPTLRILKIE